MDSVNTQLLLDATSYILPVIIAITLHEAGHAFAAYRLGDTTAKSQGRMSLDPVKHIDPFGTIFVPCFLLLMHSSAMFGWAKPVPVDVRNLRKPRRDSILVSLAGPGMNFVLAFVSALLLHLDSVISPLNAPWTFRNIHNSVVVNVILGVFNLLPIMPLDGGRVLNGLLPYRLAVIHSRTEHNGMQGVFMIFVIAGILHIPLSYYLVGIPAEYVQNAIFTLAGLGNPGVDNI